MMGAIEDLPRDATIQQAHEALKKEGFITDSGTTHQPGEEHDDTLTDEYGQRLDGAGSGPGDKDPFAKPEAEAEPDHVEQDPEDSVEPAPERPDWLPEKFKTPEDMARSYRELEKKLGQQGKKEPPALGDPIEKSADEAEAEAEASPQEEAFSLNEEGLAALSTEWLEREGSLADETYAKLEKLGLPKTVVNRVVESLQIRGAVEYAQALDEAGLDEQTWVSMRDWASKNMDQEALDAFNAGYLSPSQAKRVLALKGLYADFRAAEGQGSGGSGSDSPREGSTSAVGLQPITSMAELQEAQSVRDDEGRYRYDTDPRYKAEVDKRAALGLGIRT